MFHRLQTRRRFEPFHPLNIIIIAATHQEGITTQCLAISSRSTTLRSVKKMRTVTDHFHDGTSRETEMQPDQIHSLFWSDSTPIHYQRVTILQHRIHTRHRLGIDPLLFTTHSFPFCCATRLLFGNTILTKSISGSLRHATAVSASVAVRAVHPHPDDGARGPPCPAYRSPWRIDWVMTA